MDRELGSAKVQTTAWIRFRQTLEDDFVNIIGFDRIELPFNSRMTEIFQGSNLNEIVNEMFAHMKTEIENPALRNSRFVFDIENIKRFANNYDFSGLKYPVAIDNEIDKFEKKNGIPVNVLGVKGRDIYICRKTKLTKLESVNLLLITDSENRHYTAVKS